MIRTACFCGAVYESSDPYTPCPRCHESVGLTVRRNGELVADFDRRAREIASTFRDIRALPEVGYGR